MKYRIAISLFITLLVLHTSNGEYPRFRRQAAHHHGDMGAHAPGMHSPGHEHLEAHAQPPVPGHLAAPAHAPVHEHPSAHAQAPVPDHPSAHAQAPVPEHLAANAQPPVPEHPPAHAQAPVPDHPSAHAQPPVPEHRPTNAQQPVPEHPPAHAQATAPEHLAAHAQAPVPEHLAAHAQVPVHSLASQQHAAHLLVSPQSKPQVPSNQQRVANVVTVSHLHTAARDVHECDRVCQIGESPWRCVYNFTLEWRYTMGSECGDCGGVDGEEDACNQPGCITADGVSRPVVTVNRSLPGPSIIVCEGDTIVVNMMNDLVNGESSSIHWHGLHQIGTPCMDGVSMVTQCPILPHTSFQYLMTADTVGTHYWHAQPGMQRADGALGPLIIRKAKDMKDKIVDEDLTEHVILINDWLPQTTVQQWIEHETTSHGDHFPHTLLINGRGHNSHNNLPLSNFWLTPKRRSNLRIIYSGVLSCPIVVWIESHSLLVTAADGGELRPLPVRSLVMFSGERYDVIPIADEGMDHGSHWMHVRGLHDCERHGVKQVGVVRYKGTEGREVMPTGDPWTVQLPQGLQLNAFNTFQGDNVLSIMALKSSEMVQSDVEDRVDHRFYLGVDYHSKDKIVSMAPKSHVNNQHHGRRKRNTNAHAQHMMNSDGSDMQMHHNHLKHGMIPTINNISFIYPSVPLLSQWVDADKNEICDSNGRHTNTTGCDSEQETCLCTHILKVQLGSVVELILVDEGRMFEDSHPMHIHGNSFRVIGFGKLGSKTTVEEVKKLDAAGGMPRRLHRAVLKDTVAVPDGGYVILRFKAENPGFWMFHCHLQFHFNQGMALMLQVGEEYDLPRIPAKWPHCGSWKSE